MTSASPPVHPPFDADPAPVPLVAVVSDVIVSANQAARSLLGEDLVGSRLQDRVAGPDRARVGQLVRSAIGRVEAVVFGASGAIVRCELRSRTAADGRRVISILEEERADTDPYDDLPDAILAVEPFSFEVVRANRAATDLLGRGRSGWLLPDAFPPARREALRHALQAGVERPAPFGLVWTSASGQHVPVEVTTSRAQGLVVLSARDLRARRREEEDRQREREEAWQIARRADTQRWLRRVGREVRELADGLAPHVQTGGIARLAEGRAFGEALLQLAREAPAVELPFDLRAVVVGAADELRRALPPRFEIVHQAPAGPVPLVGDAVEWRRSLVTLGRWSAGRRGSGRIELVAWRIGDSFWLEVRDDAPNPPQDHECARLFEPWVAEVTDTDAADGLALARVHANARLHQIGLVVTSLAGQGTRFTFHGPVAAAGNASAQPGPRARVLVIDDDPQVRTVLRRLLQKVSVVEEAPTGSDGLRALELRAFDVVLCDLQLRDESGVDVCHAIRRRHPSIRLVLMSGGAVEPTIQAGVDAVLQKPFTLDTLYGVLSARGSRSVG